MSSVSEYEFNPQDEEQDIVSSAADTAPRARTRAELGAKRKRKGKANANPAVSDVFKLLLKELPKLSKKEGAKHACGLVRNAFDCRETLRNASVRDLQQAGMLRGHALLVHKTWASDSDSSAESTSSSGSSTDDSGDSWE